MGYITKLIGEQKIENFKLAESNEEGGEQISSQDSVKPHKPLYSFRDLEMCYRSDALTFNAINKTVQMIFSGGFKNFNHEKKYVVTAFKKFFEKIGYIGNDTTFEELLESIFTEQLIYGNSFVEKIFNEGDTKIVDLAMIDPKRIDYAKKSDGSIILDENGKPIGYMLNLDSYKPFSTGDEIPKEYQELVSKDNKSIFILAKRICHFKLYSVGDKFYGIGLIEPGYKSGIYKKNMEKAKANYVYQKAFGSTVAYAGNERKASTPQERKEITKEISKLNYQRQLTLPHWVRIENLSPNSSDMSDESIKDMRIDQIAGLSIPDAFASGQGQTANKQTLGEQRTLWEFTLKDIIKRTMAYFKKYILQPINEYNDYGGVPDVEWGELRAEDIDVTADKLIRMLTAKNLHATPQMIIDIEEELRQIMNIKNSGKKPQPTQNNDKSNDVRSDIQLPVAKDKKQPRTDKKVIEVPS
ncbi:MAG: phage portal protein [Candidatus Thorarchaeota archaeon]